MGLDFHWGVTSATPIVSTASAIDQPCAGSTSILMQGVLGPGYVRTAIAWGLDGDVGVVYITMQFYNL